MALRTLIGLVFGVGLLTAVIGFASGFGASSAAVQAGSSVDLECDEDGITVTYDVVWDPADSRFEVTGFTVGDIDQPACAGKQFWVRLSWTSFPVSEFIVQTDSFTELEFNVPDRAATDPIGIAIVMYDCAGC